MGRELPATYPTIKPQRLVLQLSLPIPDSPRKSAPSWPTNRALVQPIPLTDKMA